MLSSASSSVLPLLLPDFASFVQPLYHGMFVDASIMLSPCQPLIGTIGTAFGLKPIFLM